MLSRCDRLWMRLDTNFVLLSSSERTRAPSLLLLNNSYKPGIPVTPTILLYSIIFKVFKDVQDNTNLLALINLHSLAAARFSHSFACWLFKKILWQEGLWLFA